MSDPVFARSCLDLSAYAAPDVSAVGAASAAAAAPAEAAAQVLLLTPALRVEAEAAPRPVSLREGMGLADWQDWPPEEVVFGAAEPLSVCAGTMALYEEDDLSVPDPALEADAAAGAAAAAKQLAAARAALREKIVETMTASLPELDWLDDDEDQAQDPSAGQGDAQDPAHMPMAGALDPLARIWADRSEAEIHRRLQQSKAMHGQSPVEYMVDTNELVLDEVQLRDMVRDVMREELYGAFGEKITRNVRKLVRSEVNRLLASRAFD